MPVMEQRPLAISQRRGSANANLSTLASVKGSLPKVVNSSHEGEKICWPEVKQYPYQPDHQVELLHLQAEADALLMKLRAREQKQLSEKAAL